MLNDRPNNDVDPGNAPTAGSNGHGLARPHLLLKTKPLELGVDLGGDIVDARGLEVLS
jgi:hypothetical protein